ncbi:hypothetical protein ABVE07_20665, partial [Xanthomonas euvesicatoria]
MQKTACSALARAQRWSVMLIWGALHVTWVTLAEAPEYVAGRPVLAGNAVCSSRNGIALPDRHDDEHRDRLGDQLTYELPAHACMPARSKMQKTACSALARAQR